MAAATAAHPSQDVSFQNYQQEEGSLEEIDTEIEKSGNTRDDTAVVNKIDTDTVDVIVSNPDPDDSPPHSTGGKFKLGIDDGNEFMDELTFSLQHCALPPGQVQDRGGVTVPGDDGVEGQPPPGHWVSQPHGPGSGWSRTGSLSGYSMSGRGSVGPGYWTGCGQTEYWGDEDAISDLIAIKRVDSKDIVYETKKKATKFIGKYVMGDVLGEGSYAKVKEAIDSETLIRRAVKIMKKRKLRKIPNGESNVEREIMLLKELEHKNVMKLIDVLYNDEKGKIYMVLEYCCAVLKDMLDQTPDKKFPIWQSHDYFTQLLEGLGYLHSRGIIHKDIKPGNLLLDQAGVLKIADFGVCEQLDVFSETDDIVTSQGTPAFQPPEVANGWDVFSGYKIDVWSCGITLYNFTTGQYPFEGETIFKLFENIGKCEFTVPSFIDKVLESLLRIMLSKEPVDRPDISTIRQHDWCRKRFPRTGKAVSAPPHEGDPLLCTTVLPYLENHHYPSPLASQIASEPDFLLEQNAEEPGSGVHETERPNSAPHAVGFENRLVRKKSKTTSCMKLKNGCKTQ